MGLAVFMAVPQGQPGLETFVCDATVSLAPTYSNVITSHPVERGSNITDHSYNKNPVITVQGVVSNSYSQEDYENFPGLQHVNNLVDYNSNRVQQAYDLLVELWEDRNQFQIVHDYDVFRWCVLKSFKTDFTNETSDALVFTLEAEVVRFVSSQKVNITTLIEELQKDASGSESKNGLKKEVEKDEFLLDNLWRKAFGNGD